MTAYRDMYNNLEGNFDGCEVSHISRVSNDEADNLANIGSQCLPIPSIVFWEEISERSIKIKKPVGTIKTKDCKGDKSKPDSGATPAPDSLLTASDDDEEQEELMMIEIPWIQQYLAYLVNKELPEDPVEVR